MSVSSSRTGVKRAGFTLVELLVVIGIIAVLISILLPALNKARKSAKQVQCASNMRQVAQAVILYSTSNQGSLLPVKVDPNASVYPQGFYWSNELVRGKYITAPNAYDASNRLNLGASTAFRCPEGADTSANGTTNVGKFPADGTNDSYNMVSYTEPGGQRFGIPNWYTLNCRVATGTNQWPMGSRIAPFVWFGVGDRAEVSNARYARKMSMVRKASEMVMVLEGNNYNVLDPDTTHKAPRIAARHGQRTHNGEQGITNVAFFDGHVAAFPTHKWDLATTGSGFDNERQGAIFYLNRQK